MNMQILLPAGWSLSKPFKAAWIRTGQKTVQVESVSLKNPYDSCERVFDAKLTHQVFIKIKDVVESYGEKVELVA